MKCGKFETDINFVAYLSGPGGGGVHRDPIIGGSIVIVNDVNLQISKQGFIMPLSVRRKKYSPQEATKKVYYTRI
jgi:hypothetical protein